MFYDVKVYDPQGNIKQIIPGRRLLKQHWEKFQLAEQNNTFVRLDRERMLAELKRNMKTKTSPSISTGDEGEPNSMK